MEKGKTNHSDMFLSKDLSCIIKKIGQNIVKAKGCTVWDLEGKNSRSFIINGVGCNILGYSHEEVDNAVKLKKNGI